LPDRDPEPRGAAGGPGPPRDQPVREALPSPAAAATPDPAGGLDAAARPAWAGPDLRVLHVHPTRRCNLRCLHCYSWSGPAEHGALGLALLQRAAREAAELGYTMLSLSGGEPLLYPGLFELCATARAAGMRTSVVSNGLLLTERHYIGLRRHVDVLALS